MEHMSGGGTNSESASRTNRHAYLPKNLEASERFHPVEHMSVLPLCWRDFPSHTCGHVLGI